MIFTSAKSQFDKTIGNNTTLEHSIVPVHGKYISDIKLVNDHGEKLEEYYKWQFIYSIIHTGLYPKDYIGAEVHFPKGSKSSAALILDGAIFDNKNWIHHYKEYWANKRAEDLEWLNEHLLAIIEVKRGEKDHGKVFTQQIKPALRLKDPGDAYILGIYYDREKLYLFQRADGLFLRYDESKNQKGNGSKTNDLSLHLSDPYPYIPALEELLERVNKPAIFNRSKRSLSDLGTITSITSFQIKDALSNVLRALDKAGLVNQRGYEILIQTFALKIYDEKRNEKNPQKCLEFYISEQEIKFGNLLEKPIQNFIERMKNILQEAESKYQKILKNQSIDWENQNHVRAVVIVCDAFQDFSFVNSSKSDLYQLVFYNFANKFKRDEAAQFLTPLPVIDFLVKLVNPRNDDTILDPCCGIADFLSLAFVNAQEKDAAYHLDDANIHGVDLDSDMIMLATLNMLLNGDGEAKLFHEPDKGSILFKIAATNPPTLIELNTEYHKNGNWDNWPDKTKLMKFDVVLTNPPFGSDRAYRPLSNFDLQVIEMYETWHLFGGKSIDLGVVFLENAYRSLKEEGRMGIVLSNSIASIEQWEDARKWLTQKMRIVALFDLPSNVFAETGVNTNLIVAYRPTPEELEYLNQTGYSVFIEDIKNVGYEKRTSKRNVYFNDVYKIEEPSFEIATDDQGFPIIREDFSMTLNKFAEWALGQEETLQRLFLK